MQEDIEYLKDICNIVKSDPINTMTLNSATRYHLARAIETVLNALDNSISKDKIREKIEELEKDLQDFEQTDNTGRFIRTKSRDYDKKKALEELLKEE